MEAPGTCASVRRVGSVRTSARAGSGSRAGTAAASADEAAETEEAGAASGEGWDGSVGLRSRMTVSDSPARLPSRVGACESAAEAGGKRGAGQALTSTDRDLSASTKSPIEG